MFNYHQLRPYATSLFALAIASFYTTSSTAASITFQDSFQRDNQIALFSISVDTPTSAIIRSVGYGGDPYVVQAGGFDTYLTLFDSSGNFIAENDDGENAAIDPDTGQGFDAELFLDLLPGTYTFALTQYGNYALSQTFSDGFSQAANSSYTNDSDFAPGDGCPGNLFKDMSGSSGRCRTGNYTVEFINDQGANALLLDSDLTATSATPEPGTLAMMLLGCSVVGWRTTRTRLSNNRVTAVAKLDAL